MLRLIKPSKKAWLVSIALVFIGTSAGALTWVAQHPSVNRSTQKPTQAEMLASLLSDENKIADILKTIAPGRDPIAEADWQAQLDTVKKSENQLSSLSVTESATPIKQVALGALTTISSAWSTLIDTGKTHDTTAYTKAVASLATAYQSLGTVTTQGDKAYAALEQTAAK